MTNSPTKTNVDGEKPAIRYRSCRENRQTDPPKEPEKAQLAIQEAEDLYREIRVEDALRILAERKFD
jgi:hypothetical protein